MITRQVTIKDYLNNLRYFEILESVNSKEYLQEAKNKLRIVLAYILKRCEFQLKNNFLLINQSKKIIWYKLRSKYRETLKIIKFSNKYFEIKKALCDFIKLCQRLDFFIEGSILEYCRAF